MKKYSLTATEDRAHLRKISLESQFNPDFKCSTSFIKILDKEGDVHLFIVTFERLQLEGGARGIVFRAEPVPPSRHLTERPHVNRRVVHKFRDRHVMTITGSDPVSFPLPNDLSDHKNSADDSSRASLSASVDTTGTEGTPAALATATATTATAPAPAAAVGEEKEGASLPNILKTEEGEMEDTKGIRVSLYTPIATILPFQQLSKEEEGQLLAQAHERGLFRPSVAQQQQHHQQQQQKRQRQKQMKGSTPSDDIKMSADAKEAMQPLIVDHQHLDFLDYSHLAPSFLEVEGMGLDSNTIEALVEVFGGGLDEQERKMCGGL